MCAHPYSAVRLFLMYCLCLFSQQSHPSPSYGSLPVHMYAAHSTAASALTAHVAASAASQQHRAGPSAHNQQGGSSRQEKPVRKEDYVEVEKSNMVMLVSAC